MKAGEREEVTVARRLPFPVHHCAMVGNASLTPDTLTRSPTDVLLSYKQSLKRHLLKFILQYGPRQFFKSLGDQKRLSPAFSRKGSSLWAGSPEPTPRTTGLQPAPPRAPTSPRAPAADAE